MGQVRLKLRPDYRSSSYASLLREKAGGEVLSAFSALGIVAVALKGCYLGQAVYRDAALRPMSDIDLLVHRDQFETARKALESIGYRVPQELLVRRDLNLEPSLAYFRSGTWPACLDLHMALWGMDYYRLSSSVVWDDVSEAAIYGEKVFFLSPELNFIHVAIHNLNHSGLLRDWLDLALLCRQPGFDWKRLVSLARSIGALRPLYWAFEELERSWGTPPPAEVREALREYVPHWLEDLVIRHPMRYIWRFGTRMALMDGWRSRLKYLRLASLPPVTYRHALTGSNGWLQYMTAKLGLFSHLWRTR